MTDRPLVAVLGATGAVGHLVTTALAARHENRATDDRAAVTATGATTDPAHRSAGATGATGAAGAAWGERAVRLRLGGRDAGRLAGQAVPGERVVLGEWSDAELVRFCAGADLVVNCAGPASRIGDSVLRAAVAAGVDLVDPGGEAQAWRPWEVRTRAVLGAGFSPGLTGLVARHLARRTAGALRLRGWCGGLDRFTSAAAEDILASVTGGYGTPLAAVRDGVVAPRALEPESGVPLPGFPDVVTAYPFLPLEIERVARAAGLREVDWFNAFAGARVLAAMTRHAGAADLIAAAHADLAGRSPYQALVVEATGRDGTRTLVLRGEDGYRLTAAVTLAAVNALLTAPPPPAASPRTAGGAHENGPVGAVDPAVGVPAGVWSAAEVLDPAVVLAGLGGVATVTVVDGPALVEEGVL